MVLTLHAVITSLCYVLFNLYAIRHYMLYFCNYNDDERSNQCAFRK